MRRSAILGGSALVLLALSPALAAAPKSDGAYAGTITTTGGSRPFCKGSGPLTATVTGKTVDIPIRANDGTPGSATGTLDAKGAFVATKKLQSNGALVLTGTLAKGTLEGTWKGPSCQGTFVLKKG